MLSNGILINRYNFMATKVELYISWNNALVDYFITTGTSTVFYVTKSKIEDIGKKYDIDLKSADNFSSVRFSPCL